MRHALKEAGLQNPVLILRQAQYKLNRNVIRGIVFRVSKHNIAKPKEHQKISYVDDAGIGGREKLLPGEILD